MASRYDDSSRELGFVGYGLSVRVIFQQDTPAPKKEEKKEEKKVEKKDEKKDDKKDAAPKKEGPPPPIEMKANICCEGCAERLYAALRDVDDVADISVNQSTGKITVTGKAKPEKVLKATKKVKPAAELIVAKKK